MDISYKIGISIGIGLFGFAVSAIGDGWDPGSNAGATGSIVDTRHNMTMNYPSGDVGGAMDLIRNDYNEVCVYCHTPHGANKQTTAPLWNRTMNPGNYTLYNAPTTLMRPVSTPGPNSLTCLSCHDGTIAIDSILNMPGSGLAPNAPGTPNAELGSHNTDFLNQWSIPTFGHGTIGPELGVGDDTGACLLCHANELSGHVGFKAFMLGTDMRDEHPVGVLYPDLGATPNADFNDPSIKVPGKMAFFDLDGDSYADPNEVRLYDTGDGYEVECGSCHDPHGVESGGAGTRFNPSFLRVNNGYTNDPLDPGDTAGIVSDGPSTLCLTCHTK